MTVVLRTGFVGKLIVAFSAIGVLLGQQSIAPFGLDEAAGDFEQGRAAEAGLKLDTILKDHPTNLRALVLKGAVLDSLQRYSEAESYHQRALNLAPGSAQVLNNAANHYLVSGNRQLARELYLKTIAISPQHVNANLQLAQMSVEDKHGTEALAYLSRLGDSADSDVGALLLRARALALSGRCTDASKLLGNFDSQVEAGPSLLFSTGMVFAECMQYEQAERSFSRALDADPTNFEILYNLGLAALEAGHADRATTALETALKEHPDDTGCLYALSRGYLKQKRPVDAAELLAKAQKLAPERADVVLLLAQVTAQLQFFRDAAAVYDQYLKLRPADDIARRERGFMLACANQFEAALPDLEWYASKHPADARGLYELAVAQTFENHAKALQSLDRALTLDSGLVEARYGRALLNIEDEKPAAAIEDLRVVLERQPDDYQALAHLGKAYLALDRPSDAAEVLKRALGLAPNDRLVLVQYRKVLVKLGRTKEAELILSQLKQSGSATRGLRPQADLIDSLSLPPGGQRARYLANLRSNAAEGAGVFGELMSDSAHAAVLSEAGRILPDSEQYDAARKFPQPALAAVPKNFARAAPRQDCAPCHSSQALAQPFTPMGRTLARGAASDILIAHSIMTFRRGVYSYEIVREGERSLYKVTDGHETVTVPIVWAFGLGAAGQTYVYQRDGRWYESRVSFYQKLQGLDLTMGSFTTTPSNAGEAAGRLMNLKDESDCFGCHATNAVHAGRLDAGHLTPGVQCERCHGDTTEHVNALRTGGDVQRAAMRPLGRLSAEEISDFCGQCHRTWSQIAIEGPHNINNVRFQPYRLTNSKCYGTADSRITCVACHDPHRDLEKDPAFYDSKCQACHAAQARPAGASARPAVVCPIAKKDCVTCHMPKYEIPGSHNLFSDHRIRIVKPGEPYPE